MPFMDDTAYNMDVDDLFGDHEQVTLPAIPQAPVKGLPRRLDELSASGCCQRISWAKSGCVAFISADGYAVNLRAFSRDPATGKWDLGKEWQLEVPHERATEFPYVHVAWSNLGPDLAVVDSAGRVSIFNCATALERMEYKRVDLAHPDAEMDAVVGLHWLPLSPHDIKTTIVWSATGTGNARSLRTGSYIIPDFHHPLDNKASMIYLKRFGELRMRFQQVDNTWQEVATQLGPLLSTADAFSHAAFASNSDKTSLLLAAYDVSGRLHLYKIEPKWDVKIPKAGQPPKHIEKPELIVSEICTEEICCPTGAMPTGNLDTAPSSNIMLSAQLTHLNFLPKTPEQDDGTLPTVQAIFCTPAAVQPFAQTQPHQEACSIIVRWEVQRTQQNQLHSSLDLVTSKKKSVSSVAPREELSLKRLPDLLLHSVVLTFQPFWYNMLLAYCYSDGTIEFRKRSTMEILGPDENNETLTSIFQAGFSFPQLEPSLHVALSPNYCLAACMQQDGTIKLRSMEYTYGSLSADDGDPKHSAALAALVLHCASGTNQYSSTDDIFAVMGDLSEKSKDEFLTVMFQGLNANLDCSSDESLSGNVLMLLGRSPFFAKTLSAVNLLGLKGAIERTVPSKVAWIILNIKFITQLITTITRLHGQPLDKSLVRPDMVPQLLGIVRWIVSFMTYMVDELFAVGYELQGLSTSPLNKAAIADTVAALNKPAILVLLCSFPRMMMRSWSGSLTWAFNTASRMSVQGPTVEMRRLYAPLHHALAEMPFDWRVFDTLLAETHALVRQTYQRLNLNEEQRNAAERELIRGKFPDALVPAAKWLLTDALFEKMQSGPPLADKVDVAKIVFFDTTWLGLTDSRSARRWHATHVVDVVQKMVIRGAGAQRLPVPGAKRQSVGPDGVKKEGGVLDAGAGGKREKDRLRRCTRCASWMEDVYVGMPGYTSQTAGWVVNVGRHCVCGNAWSLVEGPFP